MSNLIRRLTRNDRGELVEAEVIESPGGAEDEDRTVRSVVEPDGRITPRFKAFAARVAPPSPSPAYRQDARYAAHVDLHGDARRRALANHRVWVEAHGQAMGPVCAWLALNGCLGDDTRAVYVAQSRAGESRRRALAAIEDAKAAHVATQEQLIETAFAYLESGGAVMPDGLEVVAAAQALEGAQAAAEAVIAACQQAGQRWGKALGRTNWAEVLGRAQQARKSDESDTAVAWLKAKISPPVGPLEDPLRWI